MYEVKNSKICNFWTFWPVIQLINHLFQKTACQILKRWYTLIPSFIEHLEKG